MTQGSHEYGHADAQEKARADFLEARLRLNAISSSELLELSLMHVEPFHDPSRAVSLLKTETTAEDVTVQMTLWLAYCYIYEFMAPADLRKAVELLEEVERNAPPPAIRAAAFMLGGAALRDLGAKDEATRQFERSVALAPDWIANRQLLAAIYAADGRVSAARTQLSEALRVAQDTPPEVSSYAEEMFERLITGRLSHGNARRIGEQRDRLKTD